jgi:DNA-binding SARP family transcriptional activator
VAEAPYRERRWELPALGLYRSGRQSHALAEVRRLRRLLIEGLGVEPEPRLRNLEQRILAQDPTLFSRTATA